MALNIEKQVRQGLPVVGVAPFRQIHAHSTGNGQSTAQNEADYHGRRPVESGFFSHVVGNGRIIQTGPVGQGAYDVGGGWNCEGYAQVELIESHGSKEEFMIDYKLYVNLLRQLAHEAGLPTSLDSEFVSDGTAMGIISHAYCTAHQPNNYSDHVDPYPYLAKWGISKEQFARDLFIGFEDGEIRNDPQKIELGETDMIKVLKCEGAYIDKYGVEQKKDNYVVLNISGGYWNTATQAHIDRIKDVVKEVTGRDLSIGRFHGSERLNETLIDALKLQYRK